MTRADAMTAGLKTYDNGIPCLHGHRSRYTLSGACTVCDKLRHRKPRAANHYQYRKPEAAPPSPVAQQRRYSTFIAPPTLARLMSRR